MADRRLLENGSFRLLESVTGNRLLETSVGAVQLFGVFAPAATYKPVMLANVKGIKPRVYVPIQNNTVKTKQ